MSKIMVEVPEQYCDNERYCSMYYTDNYGISRCSAFHNCELKEDNENHYYCIRCDECKKAEVEDAKNKD